MNNSNSISELLLKRSLNAGSFCGNKIHVTWATVGMLYMPDKQTWIKNKPKLLPAFTNPAVSAYEWIDRHGFYSDTDPFHFAPQLIKLIHATPYQEIGTHTYAIIFVLNRGKRLNSLRLILNWHVR
jgi:hypothetical protein